MHASNSNIQDILLSIICLFRAAGKWRSRLGKRSVGLLRCPRPSIGTQSPPRRFHSERTEMSELLRLIGTIWLFRYMICLWLVHLDITIGFGFKSPCHTKRRCHSAQNLASTRISHVRSCSVQNAWDLTARTKLLQHAHSAHSSCWIFLLICIYFYYVQHIIANKEAFWDFVLEFYSRY